MSLQTSNHAELDRLETVLNKRFGPSEREIPPIGKLTERPKEVPPEFLMVDEGHYRLSFTSHGIVLDVDHLRRERHQLIGELAVRCDLPGARTFDGHLSIGDFNVSSVRARQERARYLASRAQTQDLDWVGKLEEFAQRVLAAERAGQPAVSLHELSRPEPDKVSSIDGLPLLTRHPVVIFGDGGTAKSLFGLYAGGRLVQQGLRVGIFDWELVGEDHRDRLERLFGTDMPDIKYVRCASPFVHEVDRLRRIVRDERLQYVVFDSVAFACDGPPEAAEVAARYFQCLRQLGPIGSLHIAHITKSEGSDQKPFGSTFWANGARATWNVKLAHTDPDGKVISIGLYNRKANLDAIRPAISFKITFGPERMIFEPARVEDEPDLAGHLSARQRMAYLLRSGAMCPEAIAEQIDAKVETVKRYARKYPKQFTVVKGGEVALLERQMDRQI